MHAMPRVVVHVEMCYSVLWRKGARSGSYSEPTCSSPNVFNHGSPSHQPLRPVMPCAPLIVLQTRSPCHISAHPSATTRQSRQT